MLSANTANTTNTANTANAANTANIQFHPLEINGQKYLICKLPDQPFSTLHDPDTQRIVGQWNNDAAQYELQSST
jgi:hypothetical protein